MLAPFQFFLRK